MKMEEDHEDLFGDGLVAAIQRTLWNLFENPNSSFGAKVSGQKDERRTEKNQLVLFDIETDCCSDVLPICCGFNLLPDHLNVAHVSGEKPSNNKTL